MLFLVVMNKDRIHLSFVMLFLSSFIHLVAGVPCVHVCCLLIPPETSSIHRFLYSIFKLHCIAYFYLTSPLEEFINSWKSWIHVVQMLSNIVQLDLTIYVVVGLDFISCILECCELFESPQIFSLHLFQLSK